MMSFEEFQYYIEEHILCGWKEQADVYVKETKKNNGITYQGLYIREQEEGIAPCIYLEEFYEEYKKGEEMDTVIERIRQEYRWAMERASSYEVDVLRYEDVKNRIIFRLINYDRNRELLTNCPFIQMYDLALTFRWLAHTDSVGISTALITNRELDLWGVSVQELLLVARENTRRLFPPRVGCIDSFLQEKDAEKGKLMYIMTNEQQINGATVLLYDNLLEDFAGKIRDNFYIVPSSIHELIAIPASEFSDPEPLIKMVAEANRFIVSAVDILSDSVYYYNRRNHRLTPVPEAGEDPAQGEKTEVQK